MCAFSISDRPPPDPRTTPTTDGRPGTGSTTVTSQPASRSHDATKAAIAPSPAPPGTRSGFTDSIATSSQISFSSSSNICASLAHEDDRERGNQNPKPDPIPRQGRPDPRRERGRGGGAGRFQHRLRQDDRQRRQVRAKAKAHEPRRHRTYATPERKRKGQPAALLARPP